MADPLALISSIAGLIAVGTKISVQLSDFLGSIRSAPSDIRDLAQELTDLCSILRRLQDIFSKNNGLHHQELSSDFQSVLNSCMDKLLQLQVLVGTYRVKEGAGFLTKRWKAFSWTFQEKEVAVLRGQLEAHKATLNIALLLSTHTETTSVKDTTDRIEVTVREIMQRLIEDGSSEITAGTVQTTSSYILQRYLSSASSVFSSRPTSPVARTSLDVIEEQEEERSGGSYQRVRKDGRGQDMIRYDSEKDDWSSDIIDFNLKSQSRNSLEIHREKVQEQQVSRRGKKREVKYKHRTEDLLTSKNRTQKPPRVREGDSKGRMLLPEKEQGVEPGSKTDKFSTTTSKLGLQYWQGESQQNPKKVSQPYVPLRELMRQSPLGVPGNSSWDQQVPWWEKEKTQLEDTVPGRKVPIVSKTSLGSDPQTHSSAQSFDLPTVLQRDFGLSRSWWMAPIIAKETQRQEHTTPSSEIQTAAGGNFGQNRWLGLTGHNKEMQQLGDTVPSWGVQGASGTLPGSYLKPEWMLMGKELEAKKAEKAKMEENTRMGTSSMSHGAIKLIDLPLFQPSALQRVLGRIAEEKAEKEKAEREKTEKEKAEGRSVWELVMAQEIEANYRELRAIIEKKKAEREKAEKEKAEKEKAEKEKAERGRTLGLMMSQGISANLQEFQAIIEKQKAEKEKAEAVKRLRDVNTRLGEVGISYTMPSIARWDALIAKDSGK